MIDQGELCERKHISADFELSVAMFQSRLRLARARKSKIEPKVHKHWHKSKKTMTADTPSQHSFSPMLDSRLTDQTSYPLLKRTA